MTPTEALAWLYSTQQFGIKLGLDNTRRLLAAMGNPERRCRFLHVAGTNGKGSVCAMLDSILRASGHRCGLYTSPHLIDFRERIRVDGVKIPEASLGRGITSIREIASGWEHAPTFFEVATVLAIWHFANEGVPLAVLETGMGGRLDATNAVTPLVSVITPLALDHMQWLGETLELIAREKAGIIKPGVPAVSARQEPEAAAVVRSRAEEIGSPLTVVSSPLAGVEIGLAGRFQPWNAALAIETIEAAGIEVDAMSIRAGLAAVRWPGRFQRIGNMVLDGAHNCHATGSLVQTWRDAFGDERATVIFGALADKDYRSMLETLRPIAEEIIFVTISVNSRAEDAEALAEAFGGGVIARSVDEALAAAEGTGRRILVTGSLFLVGEVLSRVAPDAA